MGLFYRVSVKDMTNLRNKLLVERGLPALHKNGFEKAPFPCCWYGRDGHNGFSYTLCRLNSGLLEMLDIFICRGDQWIQFHLNIFELSPAMTSLAELSKSDGINYCMPPNSLTSMRLRSDDYKFIPFITVLFYTRHKLGSYHSPWVCSGVSGSSEN